MGFCASGVSRRVAELRVENVFLEQIWRRRPVGRSCSEGFIQKGDIQRLGSPLESRGIGDSRSQSWRVEIEVAVCDEVLLDLIAARDEGLLAQSRRWCPIVLSCDEVIVQPEVGLDILLESRDIRGLCRGSTGYIVADN